MCVQHLVKSINVPSINKIVCSRPKFLKYAITFLKFILLHMTAMFFFYELCLHFCGNCFRISPGAPRKEPRVRSWNTLLGRFYNAISWQELAANRWRIEFCLGNICPGIHPGRKFLGIFNLFFQYKNTLFYVLQNWNWLQQKNETTLTIY